MQKPCYLFGHTTDWHTYSKYTYPDVDTGLVKHTHTHICVRVCVCVHITAHLVYIHVSVYMCVCVFECPFRYLTLISFANTSTPADLAIMSVSYCYQSWLEISSTFNCILTIHSDLKREHLHHLPSVVYEPSSRRQTRLYQLQRFSLSSTGSISSMLLPLSSHPSPYQDTTTEILVLSYRAGSTITIGSSWSIRNKSGNRKKHDLSVPVI